MSSLLKFNTICKNNMLAFITYVCLVQIMLVSKTEVASNCDALHAYVGYNVHMHICMYIFNMPEIISGENTAVYLYYVRTYVQSVGCVCVCKMCWVEAGH